MIVEAEMILIKNARVMDPESGFDQVTDILLDGKKIRQIGKVNDVSGIEQVINASGMIAAPGLIDVHVHFRDPGFTYKEDLQTGSAAAAAGGFTTVVCMANTKPVVDSVDIYKEIEERCEQLPIKVWQAAAVSKGFEGKELTDMDALYKAGVRGFTDDGIPLMDEKLVEEAMKKAKELDVPISLHEEDPAYIKQPGVNQGKVSEQLNYGGASYMAEAVMVKRDCELAVKTGAKVDIQHISSGVAVDYVKEAKAKGANVYAEASPHHFTLTEEAVLKYGTLARMNPPLRTEEDRQRIIKGLQEGTIEIIATDHAPHSKEEKDKPLDQAPSGITGLETSLALGVTELVGKGYLSMMQLLEKMTINPAKLYNMEQGRLQEGKPADVVLFDPEEEWEVKEYKSKATNSPFTGWKLKGKVKYTICDGKIVEL
jgi:dihydroorotase